MRLASNAISNRFQRPILFFDDIFLPFLPKIVDSSLVFPPDAVNFRELNELVGIATDAWGRFCAQEKFSRFFFATRRRERPARQRRNGEIPIDEVKCRSCASLNGGALAQAANVADAKSRTAAKFRRAGLPGVNSADVPKKVDRSTPARSSSRRTPIGPRGNVATAKFQLTR